MAVKKYLDDNGLLYYHQRLKELFNAKVDKDQGVAHGGKFMGVNGTTGLLEPMAVLTPQQWDVVNANPFTTTEKNKLISIDNGAEVNIINTITVNGTNVPPVGTNVDLDVPTHLSDLDATGFNYVESVAAGSSNVVIGGTAKNPIITVAALEMPDEFTSTESPSGGVGTELVGMDANELTPIIPGATLSLSDIVIFANNIQAVVSSIDVIEDEYNAVITRIPAAVSFGAITGDPMSNTNLAAALDTKIEGVTLNGEAGVITSKIVALTIESITNSEIDTIMSL